MLKASAAIQKALKDKEREIVSGEKAMLAILEELHRQVMAELGQAALGSWDQFHLRRMLDSIEYQMEKASSSAQTTLSGLLDKSWGMGVAMIDAPLAAGGIYTGYHISSTKLEALKGYSNDYLRSLFGDAWFKVKGEITLGVIGGKSPQDVAAAIGRTMKSGRFENIAARAETITRHEMGTIYSSAADLRLRQAAEYVEGLEKQWLHAGHPMKARPIHEAMDGHHVPVDKPFFYSGGTPIMYPRDLAAPLSETMNCGCDEVAYMEAWAA
ncbi:MAG: phage head morphogenesis protein [Deltaproteobacteria bacterium]|nr:phage head morphogenesis protein [Deltaproteobacteria bacterium]